MCCGFSKRARKAWQLRSPLRGLLSASVSISVGLAHTEESNFRNGNEKSSSGVIWLQCGLTMQCVGKEEGPFPEHFLNKGTCHHGQECWGGYTGSEEIELVTSMATHTPGPALHLWEAPSPVCLCRLPVSRTEMRGVLLTLRFPSWASPFVAVEILILLLFLFFIFSDFVFQVIFILQGHKYLAFLGFGIALIKGKDQGKEKNCTKTRHRVMLYRLFKASGAILQLLLAWKLPFWHSWGVTGANFFSWIATLCGTTKVESGCYW